MRTRLIPALAILALASCGPSPLPGGKRIADGVWWRLNALGEGERFPTDSDSAHVRVRLARPGQPPGSLYSTERWYGMAALSTADAFFGRMRTGDSATLMLQARRMPWAELGAVRPPGLADTTWLEVELAMRGMRSLEQARTMRDALLQARTHAFEDGLLAAVLADTPQHWKKMLGILCQLPPESKAGPRVPYGELVTVAYSAHFLDSGELLDRVTAKEGGLLFRLGDPDQVIQGLENAVSLLPRNGGKGSFIIPSRMAFGPLGSSSGLVPPWTPLRYEVEVLPPLPKDRGETTHH